MWSHRFRITPGAVRGAVLALALVLSTLGSSAPARAEHQMAHDPAARIQIVIKSVHVNDDHDLAGSGELRLMMLFHKYGAYQNIAHVTSTTLA